MLNKTKNKYKNYLNLRYEHVFLRLFQHLKWRRVAALTEDGQKYTEYISHMETTLKKNGIELISNQKFPRYISPEEMNRVSFFAFLFNYYLTQSH